MIYNRSYTMEYGTCYSNNYTVITIDIHIVPIYSTHNT